MSDSESEHSNLSLGASDKEEKEPEKVTRRESRGAAMPYKHVSRLSGSNVYIKSINTISSSDDYNTNKNMPKEDSDKSVEKENLNLDSEEENNDPEIPIPQRRRDSGMRKPVNLVKILEEQPKEPTIINNNYSISINVDKRDSYYIKTSPPSRIITEPYTRKSDNQPIRLKNLYNNSETQDLRNQGMYNYINTNQSEGYSIHQSSNLKQSIKFEEQEFDKGYEIYKNPKPGNTIYDKLAEGEEYYEEEEDEDGNDDDYIDETEEYQEYEEDQIETIDEVDETMDDVSELDVDQSMYERQFLKDALIESNKQYVKVQMQCEEKLKKCSSRMVFCI
jgi:hypothetical protein